MKVYVIQYRKQGQTGWGLYGIASSRDRAKAEVAAVTINFPDGPPVWSDEVRLQASWTDGVYGTYLIEEWEVLP